MIGNHMPNKVTGGITYPVTDFNGTIVEVMEWIGDLILHFMMDGITYPCWD